MRYIIANWKASKNLKEAGEWVKAFSALLKKDKKVLQKLEKNEIAIIICPSHHLIYSVKQALPNFPNLKLGAQDVSFFERGSYTGEIPASTLADLVEFAIIGHSERRKYFKETNNIVEQKTILALDNNIQPIVCVRDEHDLIPDKVSIVAYEPVHAIGTGKNEDPNRVVEMKQKLHLSQDTIYLYGGSVSEENIRLYKDVSIKGFLVGTSSFNHHTFYNLINLL